MTDAVSALGGGDLRCAPVSALLQAQENLGLVSFYLQEEDALDGWESRLGRFERVMIGDTEYEVLRPPVKRYASTINLSPS